jgi:glycosyltransferase involved in cell wall biosynthesis
MNFNQKTAVKSILIDARELVQERLTGIGRVVVGLADSLAGSNVIKKLILAVHNPNVIPSKLKNRKKIDIRKIPVAFIKSEKTVSDLSRNEISVFISPYPKLPLFGCHCASVHIIHDVLDLVHPAYKKHFKILFDGFRLKRALKYADLTWYDSHWSLEETREYAGYAGRNPRVRHLGIDEAFKPNGKEDADETLSAYGLQSGYILILGNGLPHKNLGVILEIADQLSRKMVFAGVSEKNQGHWKSRYPESPALWINFVADEDIPAIIRNSFCVAQPSTAEGYGYPPLEAMACGIPTVVSNISVLLETTGGNALVADPEDPKTWTEAFKALEKNEVYRNQVDKGLQWVEPLRGRRGWKKHVSDIEELLRGE